MDPLRYGLIGTKVSSIGGEHIEALMSLPDIELVALCDIDEGELAAAAKRVPHEVGCYDDSDALFENERLDAVIIATPNPTHEEIATRAFAEGIHVLCEKPLAPTLEGCDAIVEAAEDADRLLQVGMQRRYDRLYRRVVRAIEADELGQPIMAWSQEFRGDWAPDSMFEDDELGRVNWRFHRRLSGGTLVEKNTNDFDVFNWIAGADPVRATAVGGLAAYEERDTLDHAVVIVEYENDVKAVLQLGLFTPYGFHGRSVGFVGDQGTIEIDEGNHALFQYFRDQPDEVRFAAKDSGGEHGHGVYEENASFAECIRRRDQPFADGATGRAAVAVARAAQESIRTGDPVAIPGPGENSFSMG